MTTKKFDLIRDELWLDVVGYEGHYIVSDHGRVVSVKRPTRTLLSPNNDRGYWLVTLLLNSRQLSLYVHRLVAEAFIPNPSNLPVVNHKDGNRSNSHISNLEWVSYSQNNQHAMDCGLKGQTVPVIAEPILDCVGYWFPTQMIAARHLGLKYGAGISKACAGHLTKHKGFRWSLSTNGGEDMEAGVRVYHGPERHREAA